MCYRDFVRTLADQDIHVSDAQIRWAITSGKLPRPPMDGSLRYVFGDDHVERAKQLFGPRVAAP